MKILLSTIIFLIPLSIYAELVCPSLGGCPIIWETGECVGCVESKVKVERIVKISTTQPVKENTDVIDPYQRAYPTAPGQNLLTSSIHHFDYDKGKTGMVRITPFGGEPSFLVKRSETRIALCKSGCSSSRASTMGYKHDGFYWTRVE